MTDEEIETALRKALERPDLAVQLTGFPSWGMPGIERGTEIAWTCFGRQLGPRLIEPAFARLPAISRNVLAARFGMQMSLTDYGRQIERSRERVRQLEAKALRQLRYHIGGAGLSLLKMCLEIRIIPDGPCDPAWVSVKEAGRLTGLSLDHIRWLARQGRIIKRFHPTDGRRIQVQRISLQQYTLTGRDSRGRRRRNIWNEKEVQQ